MKASAWAIALSTCFISTFSHAQLTQPKYEAGIRLSTLVYQGDLAASKLGALRTPRFGWGITTTRLLSDRWSLRLNLDRNKLAADEAGYNNPSWKQERNFRFNASTWELAAHAVYHLKNNRAATGLVPYAFGGIGLSFTRIQRDYSRLNAEYPWDPSMIVGLTADAAHTPPRTLFMLPVGLGVRAPLNERFSMYAEAGSRFIFTDYLDGFSESGNPSRKDQYANLSVGLIYRFGNNKMNCPRY